MPRLTALRGIFAGKSRALGVVIALRERAIEQLIHDHRLAHQLFGRIGVALVQEIPAPQLHGIDADRRGNLVHVPLHGEDGLRRAEAAKCAVRNGVRGPGARTHAHIGAQIRPGGVQRGARKHRRRKRGVSAAVGGEIDLHRQQLAVACRARCGGARARDGAWWSPPGPPCGRRPSSPDGRSSWPAEPHGRRAMEG